MNRTEEPQHPMPFIDPAIALSTRQEAFCPRYAASGNAADAARQAGCSERSARQTGDALLERPYIVERLRRIRLSWKRTERDDEEDRDDDDRTDGGNRPEDGEFAPDHDIA